MDITREQRVIWAAGFFDGEGCIGIKGESTRWFSLNISCSQVDIRPLWILQDLFAGKVQPHTRNVEQPVRPCYDWQRGGPGAAAALQEMLPWLVVKREQANLALEFQTRRVPKGRLKTDAELAWDKAAKLEMSRLKQLTNLATELFPAEASWLS